MILSSILPFVRDFMLLTFFVVFVLVGVGIVLMEIYEPNKSDYHKVKVVKLFLLLKKHEYTMDQIRELYSLQMKEIEEKRNKSFFISLAISIGFVALPVWNSYVSIHFKDYEIMHLAPATSNSPDINSRIQMMKDEANQLIANKQISNSKDVVESLNFISYNLETLDENIVSSEEKSLWPLIRKLLYLILVVGIAVAVINYLLTRFLNNLLVRFSKTLDFSMVLRTIYLNEKRIQKFIDEYNIKYEDCFPRGIDNVI